MRGTITVLHPEKVIDLTQWQGEWKLSKDDLLAPPQAVTSQSATVSPAANRHERWFGVSVPSPFGQYMSLFLPNVIVRKITGQNE